MHTKWARMVTRQVAYLVVLTIVLSGHLYAQITQATIAQIESLQSEKALRSPTQRKIDSQLLYADKMKRNRAIANGVPVLRTNVEVDNAGRVLVDIDATVTDELLDYITQHGGEVTSSVPGFRAVRAWVPMDQLEPLAARNDTRFVKPAVKAVKNVGSVTSQGDTTHFAAVARNQFGVTGSGVKVGVLSDSIEHLAKSQALGDLGPVTILPGQAGIGSGEGTAMLEIVHDIAPGAELFFATAFTSAASFAQNILDLAQAGCGVIVDDVIYLNEFPFQDDLIARAVNDVTSRGVLFFSSAGNSGNKTKEQSGTWEGDFLDSGTVLTIDGQPQGRIHDFGGGTFFNGVTRNGLASILFWSDPLGGSSNDYDLYTIDPNGTVVSASTSTQDGTQDPVENAGFLRTNEKVVVVLYSGEPRFLHFENFRGRLTISTAGNIRGHNSAASAFAVAATPAAAAIGPGPNPTGPFPRPFSTASQLELFSSDGPRRVFFEEGGDPITPGNFLATGGRVRQKPDLTAADGVVTTLPANTGLNPFYGTSAASPHAAAIAALVKSFRPELTSDQIRAALTGSALDIAASGIDRDAGHGIVMADRALAALFESFSVTVNAAPSGGGTTTGEGTFVPNSTVTVTAAPATNFRFVNWTEGAEVLSTTPSYTFTITRDRLLVANFGPEPRKGTYFGLITTAPAAHETSGRIRIALTRSGAFSASLVLGGQRYAFSGRFNNTGQFVGVLNRPGAKSHEIELNLDGLTDRIVGFVRTGTNVAGVLTERAAFDAEENPAPQAGRYTILSAPADPFRDSQSFPQGFGAGAMVIDKAGRVRTAKTLGDGTKVTLASALSSHGTWPLYVSLYQRRGTAIGVLQMAEKSSSDGDGIVNWVKPPLANPQLYPLGFNMQSVFLISRYTPPKEGMRILPFPDTLSNGLFTVEGGNLSTLPPPKLITLKGNNKVVGPFGDTLKLQFTLTSGQFHGRFIDPETSKSRRFQGTVFQKQGIGAGWFRGTTEVGNVLLEPATAAAD